MSDFGDFSVLPKDVLLLLLGQNLNPSEIFNILQVNHAFNELCENDVFWKYVLLSHFPEEPPSPQKDYKSVLKDLWGGYSFDTRLSHPDLDILDKGRVLRNPLNSNNSWFSALVGQAFTPKDEHDSIIHFKIDHERFSQTGEHYTAISCGFCTTEHKTSSDLSGVPLGICCSHIRGPYINPSQPLPKKLIYPQWATGDVMSIKFQPSRETSTPHTVRYYKNGKEEFSLSFQCPADSIFHFAVSLSEEHQVSILSTYKVLQYLNKEDVSFNK